MNGRIRSRRLFSLALALLLALGWIASCGQTGDGDSPDSDDDDTGDDDDAVDDDDDAGDDDDGDDDSGMETVGWILLDDDRAHISEVLALAPEFGVDAVQLSHDLIMDIDEINQEPGKAELLRDVATEAHEAGLDVYVWAHELSNVPPVLCFDPADPVWEQRRQAYRDALLAVPEIDGVVLMFGSASPEPWYALCLCQYCLDLPPTGNPILDALHCDPVQRSHLLMDVVRDVVVGEFGGKLIFRTFIHAPYEQDWLVEAINSYTQADIVPMSKDVPQDWEPYYPHNVHFGNVGPRDQVAEFDLAGEYWGRSVIPFALPDYLRYRLGYQFSQGSDGAFGRIERGSAHIFGTPNEVNLYAFSRLVEDPDASTDLIWREWVEYFYGLAPGSQGSDLVISALRRTFDIGRKMYYSKGFWALEKGSDVPTEGQSPALLDQKAISLWDPDYEPWHQELKKPTAQTLSDLAQEKHEARTLSESSLAEVEAAGPHLDTGDYQDLRFRLLHQRRCVDIWDHVTQAVFRYQLYKRTSDEQEGKYLEWNLDRLVELAGIMEAEYGAGISPGNPRRIRAFVQDLREVFPESGDGEAFKQTALRDIRAQEVSAETARIAWTSGAPADSQVEYGLEIPDYGEVTPLDASMVTEHAIDLSGLAQGTTYVFRVKSRDQGGSLIVSGDFAFRTAAP